MLSSKSSTAGFTAVELVIATTVSMLIGAAIYYFLNLSTVLYAKNISLNYSNTSLRVALDRINVEVSRAMGMPTLINADGTDASSSTGPAAGIRFDKYIGGPFVVVHPGGAGLSASATSFQMRRSTNALASPPVPAANDVIRIEDSTTTLRPRVSSCTAGGVSSGLQTLTVNLQSALGSSISWIPSENKSADIVRRVAFVVAANGGRNELRYYPAADAVTNYSNASSYVVLTNDIGTQSGESTPFSIVTHNNRELLSIALRVKNRTNDQFLSKRELQEHNTFLRVDTLMRSRNFL